MDWQLRACTAPRGEESASSIAAKDEWPLGSSTKSTDLLAAGGALGQDSQDAVLPSPQGFLFPSRFEVHSLPYQAREPAQVNTQDSVLQAAFLFSLFFSLSLSVFPPFPIGSGQFFS